MIDTIRRATERSAKFLKDSELIAIILQILDSKIYVHYQDTYLGILVKYVLPRSTNQNNITTEQWRELLAVCTKLYKKMKSHIVLDALQMIVDYSFLHTNLFSHVKNLLLFLGTLNFVIVFIFIFLSMNIIPYCSELMQSKIILHFRRGI